MMKRFPHYLQYDAMDCGPTCLRMIAKYYGKNYSLQRLCAQSNNGYLLPKHYKLEDMAEIVVSAIDN